MHEKWGTPFRMKSYELLYEDTLNFPVTVSALNVRRLKWLKDWLRDSHYCLLPTSISCWSVLDYYVGTKFRAGRWCAQVFNMQWIFSDWRTRHSVVSLNSENKQSSLTFVAFHSLKHILAEHTDIAFATQVYSVTANSFILYFGLSWIYASPGFM